MAALYVYSVLYWPPKYTNGMYLSRTSIDTSDHSPPLSLPTAFIFTQLRTDAEKRSLVESGLSWYSEDTKGSDKLSSSSYDTGSLKTEAQSKWRKKTPSFSEESGMKGELRKPLSLSQPGSFKKGRNPPVGVTSPITHTSQSALKVAGKNQWYIFITSVFIISIWALQCGHICCFRL